MIKTINQYNLDNIASEYRVYLNSSQTLSKVSKKNYFSDINHFILWLNQSKTEGTPISERAIREDDLAGYIEYLQSNNLPVSSFNRKLSSLRNFFQFCFTRGFINSELSPMLKNITIKEAFVSQYMSTLDEDETDESVRDINEFLSVINNSGLPKALNRYFT